MSEFILCPSCASFLSTISTIVILAKTKKYQEKKENNAIDKDVDINMCEITGENVEIGDILNDLNITNMCCRMRLICGNVKFNGTYNLNTAKHRNVLPKIKTNN